MLVIVWVVFIFLSPNFLTANNMVTLFVANAFFCIAAIGQTFVLITGGIDLSIAHNVTCSALVSAIVMIEFQSAAVAAQVNPGTGAKISDADWWEKITGGETGVIQQQVTEVMAETAGTTILIGLVICILVGLAFGFINGTAIGRFGMNPFIVTLATQLIARGIAFVLSGGHSIPGIPEELVKMSYAYGIPITKNLKIPWVIFIVLAIVIIAGILLDKTRWGRYLKLVGSNPASAKYVGINVRNVTASAYIASGLLGGIGGFISMMVLGTADVKLGDPLLLPVIGSIILGGISMRGGEGNIVNSILGIMMFATIINGMTFLNLTIAMQQIILGSIFVIGMSALARLKARRV
jgi:ribose transport system permease protein